MPLTHVKREESVIQLQTTPLTPVDVLVVGKVRAAAKMWMNAERTHAKMELAASTAPAATCANVNLDIAGTTVRQTLTTAHLIHA